MIIRNNLCVYSYKNTCKHVCLIHVYMQSQHFIQYEGIFRYLWSFWVTLKRWYHFQEDENYPVIPLWTKPNLSQRRSSYRAVNIPRLLFLFQPTNAQLIITTVSLYIIYIPICFDISVSSSGILSPRSNHAERLRFYAHNIKNSV